MKRSSSLRVAFDASILSLPPSGTGTYARSLIDALRRLYPDLQLDLLHPDWGVPAKTGPLSRMRTDRRVRRMLWDAWHTGRAASAGHPQILHVPQFAAPVWPPCPMVVTIHDAIPFVLPAYRGSRASRLHAALMRRTTRRARLVLTPSRTAADDLHRVLGIPCERIRVTPEAADPSFRPGEDPVPIAEVRNRFDIAGRYVFNVGGLDARKNLTALIEAFGRVVPAMTDDVALVIAGAAHTDNPVVYPPLEPIVARLGLEQRVRLIGRITEADKLALFQGASVYVTPSIYEGFGLTALEAMSTGVPTIAAARTSLPEVVGDGGILIEPTADGIAAALLAVLSDDNLARDLRACGLVQAARFSWDETARLTRAAYDEILAER